MSAPVRRPRTPFPGAWDSDRQIAGDVKLVAFLEVERRYIRGNVPVDGPVARIDPVTRAGTRGVRGASAVAMGGIADAFRVVTVQSENAVDDTSHEVGVMVGGSRSAGQDAEATSAGGWE